MHRNANYAAAATAAGHSEVTLKGWTAISRKEVECIGGIEMNLALSRRMARGRAKRRAAEPAVVEQYSIHPEKMSGVTLH
jgi:hypothetical protein